MPTRTSTASLWRPRPKLQSCSIWLACYLPSHRTMWQCNSAMSLCCKALYLHERDYLLDLKTPARSLWPRWREFHVERTVWAAVFTFNPYLLISINELMISIIHLLISINELLISINDLLISINELLISKNTSSSTVFIDINNSFIDINKGIIDINNSFIDINKYG